MLKDKNQNLIVSYLTLRKLIGIANARSPCQGGKYFNDKEAIQVMKRLKQQISDHMPTVARFYFTQPENR